MIHLLLPFFDGKSQLEIRSLLLNTLKRQTFSDGFPFYERAHLGDNYAKATLSALISLGNGSFSDQPGVTLIYRILKSIANTDLSYTELALLYHTPKIILDEKAWRDSFATVRADLLSAKKSEELEYSTLKEAANLLIPFLRRPQSDRRRLIYNLRLSSANTRILLNNFMTTFVPDKVHADHMVQTLSKIYFADDPNTSALVRILDVLSATDLSNNAIQRFYDLSPTGP